MARAGVAARYSTTFRAFWRSVARMVRTRSTRRLPAALCVPKLDVRQRPAAVTSWLAPLLPCSRTNLDIMPRHRRKPQAQRKTVMVRVRVTVEQKQLFEAAARNAGLDLSGWMRFVSLREARRQGVEVRP